MSARPNTSTPRGVPRPAGHEEAPRASPVRHGADHDDVIHPSPVPFVLVHVACLAAVATGVTAEALALCGALYAVRMFGVAAGYHRYFSHRAFRTSRAGQFALAWLAQSSAQRGVLWWAAKHREHHRHADTEDDVHSPRHRGFWHAHVGWIFTARHDTTDLGAVPDLARFPELRWLQANRYVPAIVLAVGTLLLAGWSGLVVGFFWSTVLLYHGTFLINSLAHVHGTRRYVTGDDSRNNWWLALLTLGEGWHNNHHAYMTSTRQGFRWWEVDVTYYVLKALSWPGVVWDLQEPPRAVVRNERPLGRRVVEKVARQLAAGFPVAAIAARTRDGWTQGPWPFVPTLDVLGAHAAEMRVPVASAADVARRARELIVERVATELVAWPAGAAPDVRSGTVGRAG
jgi:stearoyl-CoA desaturase (Delta-9 desaturase)